MSVVRPTAGLLNTTLHRTRWDFVAVALGAALASGLSYAHYRFAGQIFLNADAVSRLNIARRVFDSLDPGAVQLGTIWPPAPQVLMLPLVWIDPLWRSGLAGSIPSMMAFVCAAVYIYALGRRLTRKKLGGTVALLVFVTNPSMLYLQAIPLSESLMILTVVAAAYHLAAWLQEERPHHLTFAAAWVFVSSLTRYEGWALVLAGAVLVFAFTRARHRDSRRAEALLLMFVVPAGLGVLLWLLYSATIFGDPLVFLHGVGSASADANDFAKHGLLLTKGSLARTMLTYGWTAIDFLGLPVIGTAALGLATMMVRRVGLRQGAIVIILLVPALVTIGSLYLGSAFLFEPHSKPGGILNTRYAALLLPAVAILPSFLAALHRYVAIVLIIGTLSLAAYSYQMGAPATSDSNREAKTWIGVNYPVPAGFQPVVVVEGLYNAPATIAPTLEAAGWLHENNKEGGLVLISANANMEFMFYTGLPLRDFVCEGARPYWNDEMRSPGTWTDWIVLRKNYFRDLVELRLADYIEQSDRFVLAFENGNYKIFRVVSPVALAGQARQ